MRKQLILAALLLALAGCTAKEPLPVYPMEVWEDGVYAPVTIDGVRYAADTDRVVPSSVRNSSDSWALAGETGPVIGVGGDPEKGSGGYDIYGIVGDEERRFLYLRPNHFVFGPYYTFVCIREDVTLEPPSAETAGRAVWMEEGVELMETTDAEQIAALFDFYAANAGSLLPGDSAPEERTPFTIRVYHRAYPFLAAEFSGTRVREGGGIYLRCQDEYLREFTAWEMDF